MRMFVGPKVFELDLDASRALGWSVLGSDGVESHDEEKDKLKCDIGISSVGGIGYMRGGMSNHKGVWHREVVVVAG